MREKEVLWISLLTLVATLIVVPAVTAPGPTTLAAPFVMDTGLTPGSTFYIDITVADVSHLWGFEFVLTYDTSILTATDYTYYAPFYVPWPSEINDAAGYVSVAYSMMFGEEEGFSTVPPAPIARIDFTVDALGGTYLDIHDSILTEPAAAEIPHEMIDGYFANIAPQWSANLVRKSAWPEHHHWDASKDADQTIFGKVRGLGTVPTNAYVKFTINNGDGLWEATFETDTVTIGSRKIVDLTVTVTPGDLNGYGKYYVKAQCWYDSDGDGITDATGTKLKSFAFALVP